MAFFSSAASAQLPDTATLTKQKIFISLDEALLNPSEVYRLDLSKQHLEQIPAGVFMLANLQEMNLSHNKIKSIPCEIKSLKNLRIIDLSSNKLITLPAEIGTLTYLQKLYLKHNKISTLPIEMALLISLSELDLWGNRIIRFPAQMASLRNTLKKIDMRGITIKTPQRNAITDLLPDTDIYFTGCNCN
ncbi:MAG: leucine-rich repeat domain-containing protein [Bacteroidota bacterium]